VRRALVAKLDKVFSEWVRRSAADSEGYAECFTCRKKLPWREMHNGHFALRQHKATRWEPLNAHPQCAYCNNYRAGEQYEYGKRLDEVYGPGTADSLMAASRRVAKWPEHQLKAEIARIQSALKILSNVTS
jgi:hypothetical protein